MVLDKKISYVVFTTFVFVNLYFCASNKITKALPAIALGLFSWNENHIYGTYIAVGLFLSSIGDICLEIESREFDFFILGLIFFLIAHIFYIIGFSKTTNQTYSIPLGLFLISTYLVIMYKLLPYIQSDLSVPIIFYCFTIFTMIFQAGNRFIFLRKIQPTSATTAIIGACIFAVSDLILAIDKFVVQFPKAKMIVMITYYSAQTLITCSTIKESVNNKKK
jgi:uncharacterized membrane protein YhhN